MYTIRVDGQVIYSPGLSDDANQLIEPSLQLEVDAAGSCSFTLPPGHPASDAIKKLKSIITVESEGEVLFCGRASEETTDTYNQKEIYCEGALHFLLDSVQRPFKHTGTAKALLESFLAAHNAQVDADKHFVLGNTEAIADMDALELEAEGYSDTLSAICAVLEERENFLQTRYENGVHYLDIVTSYGVNNGQAIEFGVNMIDLEQQITAGDICTVLLPVGAVLDDGTTVTIASVNDGVDTIEDAEAIAQYGRIVKTHVFDEVTDPAELKKLAQDKLKMLSTARTLTIRAVDMHLLQKDKEMIRLGTPVRIHSLPHGLDMETMCIAIDLDLQNPENTVYTFGKPVRTQSGNAAAMAIKVNNNTKTMMKQLIHYKETDYTVQIHAGLLNSHEEYLAQARIEIDGINANMLLKADAKTVEEMGTRLSNAEIEIDGLNSQITLKADATVTDDLGTRLSAAEVSIDGLNSQITLKADKILLDGYVKANELDAKVLTIVSEATSYIESLNAGSIGCDSVSANGGITCEALNAYDISTTSLQLGGSSIGMTSRALVTGIYWPNYYTTTKTIHYMNPDGVNESATVVTGVFGVTSPTLQYETFYYVGGTSE